MATKVDSPVYTECEVLDDVYRVTINVNTNDLCRTNSILAAPTSEEAELIYKLVMHIIRIRIFLIRRATMRTTI